MSPCPHWKQHQAAAPDMFTHSVLCINLPIRLKCSLNENARIPFQIGPLSTLFSGYSAWIPPQHQTRGWKQPLSSNLLDALYHLHLTSSLSREIKVMIDGYHFQTVERIQRGYTSDQSRALKKQVDVHLKHCTRKNHKITSYELKHIRSIFFPKNRARPNVI